MPKKESFEGSQPIPPEEVQRAEEMMTDEERIFTKHREMKELMFAAKKDSYEKDTKIGDFRARFEAYTRDERFQIALKIGEEILEFTIEKDNSESPSEPQKLSEEEVKSRYGALRILIEGILGMCLTPEEKSEYHKFRQEVETSFAKEKEKFGNPLQYCAYHALIGSSPVSYTAFDYPGKLSIAKQLLEYYRTKKQTLSGERKDRI